MESISARARIGCRVNPAEFLLAGVIVARSTSLLLSKALLTTMSPLNILSVRFCLAFVILCAIFFNRMKRMDLRTLLMGMAIGGAFSAMMAAELFALKHTLASTTSFLENTAIVIVPLMEALLHRKLPCKRALLCAGLTLIGVGALTLRSGRFSFGLGEGLCILSAMLYALAIILTDRLSKKGDPMLIGIAQVGFIGLFTTIASFIFEAPKLPSCASEWLPILGLALVCSCFGFTLQPVAQRRIPSERASQFCALNPLSTAAMSAVLLHEKMGVMGVEVEKLVMLTFGVSGMLGGAAGVLVGVLWAIDPMMGSMAGLKGWAVAVLGGVGSISGAMVAGILLGIAENVSSAYISSGYRDAIAFVAMILTLIIKPTGLMGFKFEEKV